MVLAEACGLDVRGGATADHSSAHSERWFDALVLSTPHGGRELRWPATINPTDPDALFRAICTALCALEAA